VIKISKIKIMSKNIAVYGSLRLGEYNHRHFASGLKHLGTTTINGFKLYSLGSYPGINPGDKEDELVVDVFEADEPTFNGIHRMELGAGYHAEEKEFNIGDSSVNAIIYVYDTDLSGERNEYFNTPLVKHGDWTKR
jgi:gamma-glutamylcyclotransferase (GGCT)/AIG2-like uncharacterized protein YtfP